MLTFTSNLKFQRFLSVTYKGKRELKWGLLFITQAFLQGDGVWRRLVASVLQKTAEQLQFLF